MKTFEELRIGDIVFWANPIANNFKVNEGEIIKISYSKVNTSFVVEGDLRFTLSDSKDLGKIIVSLDKAKYGVYLSSSKSELIDTCKSLVMDWEREELAKIYKKSESLINQIEEFSD